MYLLSVFEVRGLSRLSDDAMVAIGHPALRELVVFPVGPGTGSWVWVVMGLIGGVGLLGLGLATGRWPQSGHRDKWRADRMRSSRSVRRAGSR